MSANFQQLANFIWFVADLLRGPYRPPQHERVVRPLTVLRRFDAVLKRCVEPSSKGVPNIDAIPNNLAKEFFGLLGPTRDYLLSETYLRSRVLAKLLR